MKPTIIEDEIFEFEPFKKDGSELMAAEASWRGMERYSNQAWYYGFDYGSWNGNLKGFSRLVRACLAF